jgi:hypothetical protein
MMIKRLVFLLVLVPAVAQAECWWINGQYACTLTNNQPYVPPVVPNIPPPPNYYYAPGYVPPPVYVPPVTPGYYPPPPPGWGDTKIVPLPERRNLLGD